MFGGSVADSLDAIKRDAAHLGQTGDTRCLHVDEGGLVGFGEAQFFVGVGDSGAGHQPGIIWGTGSNKALPGSRIDDGGDVVGQAEQKLLAQGSRPAGGDHFVDGAGFFDLGKGACGRGNACSGAGGNPFALVEAPAPEIDAVAALVPPAADQRLQFGGHGGDDGSACHFSALCA